MEDGPVFFGFKNIFITMFATFFFFKLLIKVFLALLTHFYIVKGNRKEAARIAEEIYGGISVCIQESCDSNPLDNLENARHQWSHTNKTHKEKSIKMLQLTGGNEKNFKVSESVRRTGPWKEISFGDYICHTFQGVWPKSVSDRLAFYQFWSSNFPLASGDCWADRSPLHEAAAQGRLLVLKTLIEQGVNVNLVTINRVSSLHEACLGGHMACAKVLLENGAHVNGMTVHGATPLFNACCSGSAACVNVLLEFGAKTQPVVQQASPIHEAVKRGHKECMEILLANNVNINQELPQLGTPLYVACTYQKVDCVKKLLELGASVDHGRRLDTPLHAAARKTSVEIVHLLADYGANLKLRNALGKTPLDLAAPGSSVEDALLFHKGPLALSQLCRLCVWKCLGQASHQVIQQLHLPEPLKKFLLYQ